MSSTRYTELHRMGMRRERWSYFICRFTVQYCTCDLNRMNKIEIVLNVASLFLKFIPKLISTTIVQIELTIDKTEIKLMYSRNNMTFVSTVIYTDNLAIGLVRACNVCHANVISAHAWIKLKMWNQPCSTNLISATNIDLFSPITYTKMTIVYGNSYLINRSCSNRSNYT